MTPINIWTSDKDVNLPLLGCKIEDLFCLMSITVLDNTAQLTQASLFLSEYKHYYQTLFPRRDKDFTNQKTKTNKKQKLLNPRSAFSNFVFLSVDSYAIFTTLDPLF